MSTDAGSQLEITLVLQYMDLSKVFLDLLEK